MTPFTTSNKQVPFSYVVNNFKAWFRDMKVGKGTKLSSKRLPRSMNDKAILAELKPKPCSLGDLYETLKTLDHEVWGIFYIKDKNKVLRAVSAHWRDGGWHVYASPVADPDEWSGEDQIFSRNFSYVPSISDTLESRVLSLENDMSNIKKFLIL
jgi:hypothetical protein